VNGWPVAPVPAWVGRRVPARQRAGGALVIPAPGVAWMYRTGVSQLPRAPPLDLIGSVDQLGGPAAQLFNDLWLNRRFRALPTYSSKVTELMRIAHLFSSKENVAFYVIVCFYGAIFLDIVPVRC
jgi:hypothetical protein